MSNLKWADVAHYYQFSGIDLEIGIGTRPFRGVAKSSEFGEQPKRGLFLDRKGNYTRTTSESLDQYRPILRHLEDMTEGEAREFFMVYAYEDWEIAARRHELPSAKEWFSNLGQRWMPLEFHWLISKGFDVFGLTEAGQAIRKGVGS